jgi:TetR/AcrR family transcriptional regulator, regulator of cefoperazone and chloramphenicol sensitivity
VNADPETRERLIEAGERLFGERGFRKVTVREICRAAHANVAAVNYHFGDKLGLYREVLQRAIDAMRATTEAARQAGKGQSPEEQLRRYVKLFLRAILSPESLPVHRLLLREINEPTPALDAIVEQAFRPRIEYLAGVVARMIGSGPHDPRVLRCIGSIQSQHVAYMRNPIAERLGFRFEATPAHIDEAAEHITRFSLGGVRAVAQAARSSLASRSSKAMPSRRTSPPPKRLRATRRRSASSL